MGVSVGFAGGLLLHHATEMTQKGIHIFSFLIGQ